MKGLGKSRDSKLLRWAAEKYGTPRLVAVGRLGRRWQVVIKGTGKGERESRLVEATKDGFREVPLPKVTTWKYVTEVDADWHDE